MTLAIIYSIAVIASCVALAIAVSVAPEGYEDGTGFHYGEKP